MDDQVNFAGVPPFPGDQGSTDQPAGDDSLSSPSAVEGDVSAQPGSGQESQPGFQQEPQSPEPQPDFSPLPTVSSPQPEPPAFSPEPSVAQSPQPQQSPQVQFQQPQTVVAPPPTVVAAPQPKVVAPTPPAESAGEFQDRMIKGEQLKDVKRAKRTYKLENAVGVLFGSIEAALAIRLIFKLLGASGSNAFVNILYQFTGIFATPFSGIFGGNPMFGRFELDIASIIAMIIYAIFGFGALQLTKLF